MHDPFFNSLHDPAVRDLAWVIGSPVLVNAAYPAYSGLVVDDVWCKAQLQACSSWLTELEQHPLPLHEFIASRPTRRLGHYFETLISFWLAHIPDTQLIATNLQVQLEQRTLGEYDFLFRDSYGKTCHWEAAVKFYLQTVPLADASAFIGPGAQDRLDIKLDRVFRHQLSLGSSDAGKQALPPDTCLHQAQAFIKGYLFYHPCDFNRNAIPGVSSAHLSGWWIRHKQDILPRASADTRWITLPRMRWLSPAFLPLDTEVMTFESVNILLDSHFSIHTDARLLFEMKRTDSGWQECSRGFVVCENWPNITEGLSGRKSALQQ